MKPLIITLVCLVTFAAIFESWQYNRMTKLEEWAYRMAASHNALGRVTAPQYFPEPKKEVGK